jgi:hypothetical protein
MRDNELISLIISTIIAQEAVAGIAGTPIQQAFQPTQQGANTEPTAYLHKIGDTPRGSPGRSDAYVTDIMQHTEVQAYETRFQFSALSTQNPSDTTQMTASDLLNLVRYILTSSQTIAALNAQDVGILRVEQVMNTPFVDDRGRHEYQPSLDFIVTHKQIVSNEIPVIESTELEIYPV